MARFTYSSIGGDSVEIDGSHRLASAASKDLAYYINIRAMTIFMQIQSGLMFESFLSVVKLLILTRIRTICKVKTCLKAFSGA
jgi:hypothetical protein